MAEFELHYLADKPEWIEACAAWSFGRWGVQRENGSWARSLARFQEAAQKDALPLTIIALNTENGRPVAMASLVESDSDYWTEVTPWIAGVFVLYRYRGHGLARRLVERLEEEARRLGVKNLYLYSGSAAKMYPKLGYVEIDSVESAQTAAGREVLLVKDLTV
ncbi:MAG: GNAT family N-acetyltransferase [Proteobacteria bacterium]|nr:GNAT family N-acetyltransferase [Pseudomonadota bacterium]